MTNVSLCYSIAARVDDRFREVRHLGDQVAAALRDAAAPGLVGVHVVRRDRVGVEIDVHGDLRGEEDEDGVRIGMSMETWIATHKNVAACPTIFSFVPTLPDHFRPR